ncbi:MAG: hypothetical protein LBF88_05500, partial [Planctomycetaceae bacterium]|nr:hypothetical protein [Planctomycetaceae bacterium]
SNLWNGESLFGKTEPELGNWPIELIHSNVNGGTFNVEVPTFNVEVPPFMLRFSELGVILKNITSVLFDG